MDAATESKLAALIMADAARKKREAEIHGVQAFLNRKVRKRPNSRFLLATVRGVQQVNRMTDVSEMWRRRTEEIGGKGYSPDVEENPCPVYSGYENESRKEIVGACASRLDSRRGEIRRHRDKDSGSASDKDDDLGSLWDPSDKRHHRYRDSTRASLNRGSRNRADLVEGKDDYVGCTAWADEGLDDKEMQLFLQRRAKRGRGATGPRMDEPGPFLSKENVDVRLDEDWELRIENPTPSKFAPRVLSQGPEPRIQSQNDVQRTSDSESSSSCEGGRRNNVDEARAKERKRRSRSRSDYSKHEKRRITKEGKRKSKEKKRSRRKSHKESP